MLKRLHSDCAQNALEYLLVLGAVGVVMVTAMLIGFPALVQGVASQSCPSLDTAADPAATAGSCIVVAPPAP